MLNKRIKTLILDIDGTILKHFNSAEFQHNIEPEILPGVLEKFRKWEMQGYKIILLSGRKECTRKQTEEQLAKVGLIYDQLILDASNGERILINDTKPDSDEPTAKAITVKRNQGLEGIDI